MDKKELLKWFDSKIENYIHGNHYDGNWDWEQIDDEAREELCRLIESSGERTVSREWVKKWSGEIYRAVRRVNFGDDDMPTIIICKMFSELGFEVKP